MLEITKKLGNNSKPQAKPPAPPIQVHCLQRRGRRFRLPVLPIFLLGVAGHGPPARAQSPGAFAATASMAIARSFHTATLLMDGRVLIAGGDSDSSATATPTTEIYDPVKQTFTPSGNMTVARLGHTATLLPDGRVLMVGGDSIGSAELYNPSTGSFTATGGLIMARQEFNATLLMNGKVLITGGVASSTESVYVIGDAELYDPSTGVFAAAGAGNGGCCFTGDGGSATGAQLYGAGAVAVDATGNIFIADSWNFRLRKVSPDGIINTVAGESAPPATPNSSGAGGPATSGLTSQPWGIIGDAAGNLLIVESADIQKISADGNIYTVPGSADGMAIAEDAAGNLFTAGLAISKVSPSGLVTRVAGVGAFGTPGVGGYGIAADGADNLFVGSGGVVSKIAPSGAVSTIAGGGKDVPGDGGQATSAQLNNVTGVLLDGAGNLLLSETYGNRVRKVSPDGIITTIAGTGTAGVFGDGGQATSAQLNGPDGLALDAGGNLYIAETYSNRIRLVTPDGIITTIAGTGAMGFSGDGGPAVNAELYHPWSVARGPAGQRVCS